jgi:hypothetical protein
MGAPGLTKPSETLEDREQVPISGKMGEKPRNLGIETGKRWENVEKMWKRCLSTKIWLQLYNYINNLKESNFWENYVGD